MANYLDGFNVMLYFQGVLVCVFQGDFLSVLLQRWRLRSRGPSVICGFTVRSLPQLALWSPGGATVSSSAESSVGDRRVNR